MIKNLETARGNPPRRTALTLDALVTFDGDQLDLVVEVRHQLFAYSTTTFPLQPQHSTSRLWHPSTVARPTFVTVEGQSSVSFDDQRFSASLRAHATQLFVGRQPLLITDSLFRICYIPTRQPCHWLFSDGKILHRPRLAPRNH